jgi:type IV pilus assembly protein PilQ
MKKICLWTAATLLVSFLCLADAAVLQQVAVSRQGDRVILSLEADGNLAYAAYPGEGDRFVVELSNLTLDSGIKRRLESTGLDKPILLEAHGGNIQILLPLAAGIEPEILKQGHALDIRFPVHARPALREVQVQFDGDTPVVRMLGDGLPQPKMDRLSHPDRIILDFPGTLNQSTHGAYFINQRELSKVRVSQFQLTPTPVARVVLETPRAPAGVPEPFDEGLLLRLGDVQVAEAAPPPVEREIPIQEAAPVPQTDQVSTLYEVKKISKGSQGYSGEPISFNLKDAPIQDVLQSFAELTGLNFVLDPGVSAKVTVRLDQVPWDQALELILKINNLGYTLENNVMRIAPVNKLSQEAQQKRQLEKEEDLNLPIQTIIKRLSYSRAGQIQANVKKVMSDRGDLFVDDRTNTLIMMDIDKYIPRILDLIKALDLPPRQVQIEARIVETTKNFTQKLGVQWGFTGVGDTLHGNTTGLKFPSTYSVLGDVALPQGGQVLGMNFGNILGSFNLDLALTAAEADGLVKVVSSPRVVTQDNLPARIQSGIQIPVQTTANNTTTVQYIDATLMLNVTPQITEAGTISMQIQVQKKEPLTGLSVTGGTNAPLSTREATTQVMVKDGGTTVIGGIYQITDNNSQNRIPFLHRIPILGNLFKDRNIARRHDELLIFITPRVVKSF